jgi:hypothetical protein
LELSIRKKGTRSTQKKLFIFRLGDIAVVVVGIHDFDLYEKSESYMKMEKPRLFSYMNMRRG